MKKYIHLIALLVFSVPAMAQVYNDVVTNSRGEPIAGASYTVCTVAISGGACSSPATLYTDQSLTVPCNGSNGCSNPAISDSLGRVTIYTTPNVTGTVYYTLVSAYGSTTYTGVIMVPGGGGGSAPSPPLGSYQLYGSSSSLASNPLVVAVTTQATGSDLCGKINSTILANPHAIIDARGFTGNQSCASNPLSAAAQDIVLLLGDGVTIQTTVPWQSTSGYDLTIVGAGRGANGRGTTIQAVSGFPATCDGSSSFCPVIRLGDGSGPAFGQRLENLSIDCNSQPTTVGVYSTDINEHSGLEHFTILGCPVNGILIDGSGGPGIGAANYFLNDGEVYSQTAGTGSTINILLISTISATNGPRYILNVTSNGAAGHIILSDFTFMGISSGAVIGTNAESAVTGYTVEPNGSSTSQTISFLNPMCNLITTNCMWLKAPLNDIEIFNVLNNPGSGTPVTIKDDTLGQSYSDFSIAQYTVANAQRFRLSSVQNGFQLFQSVSANALQVSNQVNSVLQVDLDSGKTASQGQALLFSDRGTNKWNIADLTNYSFQVYDYANSIARIRFDVAGNDEINSIGTQPVQVNADPGSSTGGFQVCNGSSTCGFQVTGAGTLFLPTLSDGCLNITSGAVGSTGTPCGSGGGGGTVSVVGAGSLTNNAIVTGGGAQAIQTPSSTSTLDSSGNVNAGGYVCAGGSCSISTLPTGAHGFAAYQSSTAGVPTSGVCYIRADSTNGWVQSCNNAAETLIGSGAGGGYTTTVTSQTTFTILGTTHNLGTSIIAVECMDNSTPRLNIGCAWTINDSTHDVTVYFASPQTGVINLVAGGGGGGGGGGGFTAGGDLSGSSSSQTVIGINNTNLAGLGTGLLQLTSGIPSIAGTISNNTTGLAANLSGTPALPNGTTATTQTIGDNTAKLATDAFVIANAGGGSSVPVWNPPVCVAQGAAAGSAGTSLGGSAVFSSLPNATSFLGSSTTPSTCGAVYPISSAGTQYLEWHKVLEPTYVTNAVGQITVQWYVDTATSGNIFWGIQFACATIPSTVQPTYATKQLTASVNVTGTVNQMQQSTIATPTLTCSAGSTLWVRIKLDSSTTSVGGNVVLTDFQVVE